MRKKDETFFAAIREAPDDDAPRLVYADVLLQRGNPWGEVIAVQCAKAAKERADDTTTEAYARIVRREHELLAARDTWWRSDADHVTRFARGFPEDISFGGVLDVEASEGWLRLYPPFRRARLELRGEWNALRLIRAVPYMPMRVVSLLARAEDNYALDVLDARLLARWLERVAPQLEGLEIGGELQPEALRRVLLPAVGASLKRLTLTNPRNVSLRNALPATLEDVELTWLDGPRDVAWALAGLPLRAIALRASPLAADEWLTNVAKPSRFERIELEACGVVDASLERIAPIAGDGLRHLSLSNNPLTANALERIAAAPWRLRSLSLWGTGVADAGAEIIARSPAFESLLELELQSTGMTERGAAALAASPYLPPGLRLRVSAQEAGGQIDALSARFAVVLM